MNELNNIGEGLGIIGLMGFYIWFKVWMYKREYNNEAEYNDNTKDKEDIVIKRGSEWDYEYKDTKKNKNK